MKKIIALFSLLLCLSAQAQDHIYSQFYNAPNYLNPALNGQFEGDLRMNLIYRNQWTAIPGNLSYYTFSLDYQVPRFGGGVGIMATRSSEGVAFLNKTNISSIYSYSVDFDNAVLSFGLQAGITNRTIDFTKLVYLDQLDASGIIPGGLSAASPPQYNNRFFFDSGAGVNLVWGSIMLGTSAQHLNRPDESFSGTRSTLPIRTNAYASYRILMDPFDEENSAVVIPSVIIYRQAKVTSFSFGGQFKRKSINVGLWYRSDGAQQDAIVVSFIFDLFKQRDSDNKFRFGLSHDAATSKLPYTRTAGTTEGAFSYETTLNEGNNYYYRGVKSNDGKRCYDFY